MKIIGIILVVIGAGLAFWGYRLSGGVGAQISQAVSGSPTDKIMTFYIGGAASLLVGLYLLFKK
jgi:H+/gluconate symporter-like permease